MDSAVDGGEQHRESANVVWAPATDRGPRRTVGAAAFPNLPGNISRTHADLQWLYEITARTPAHGCTAA